MKMYIRLHYDIYIYIMYITYMGGLKTMMCWLIVLNKFVIGYYVCPLQMNGFFFYIHLHQNTYKKTIEQVCIYNSVWANELIILFKRTRPLYFFFLPILEPMIIIH